MPDAGPSSSPFWRFSLRFYALPGVAPACLELQDRCGADVNLLLYLLFLAERRTAVTAEGIVRLDGAVRSWREQIVKPLREMRRALKPGIAPIPLDHSDPLRAGIKRLELDSERIEQQILEGLAMGAETSQADTPEAAAEASLAAYRAHLGGDPADAAAAILAAFAARPRPPI